MSDDNAAITHVIRLVLRAIHRPSSSSNNSVPQFEDVKKNRMIEKKEAEEAGESTMMVPIPREPSFAALPSQGWLDLALSLVISLCEFDLLICFL